MMSEFVEVGDEIEIPGMKGSYKIVGVDGNKAICMNTFEKTYAMYEENNEVFFITTQGKILVNLKRKETPTEIEYMESLRSKSNTELDREFLRINKLRNKTDNDFVVELRCLNKEAGKRYHELPNEITEDRIHFFANQFSGYVNWTQYNFKEKQFIINHRLSDVWVIYDNVSRVEYQAFLKADDKDEFIKEFEKRYDGVKI